MEGEEVDWMYHDITIEITKPSHSKEIFRYYKGWHLYPFQL